MFEGYRVIVVCPAGRRHVADLLRRHVERARPVVDKLHWWLNTDNQDDLDYFGGLARAAPDFHRTIAAGPSRFRGRHMGIGRFFVHAVDPATIYVRADDDVVWMDERCIAELLAHRLRHPEAYLVYGNIVNSSRFMHLHQRDGAFDPGFPVSYQINHPTNRHSVEAGLAAHHALLATAEAIAAGGDRATLLAPWTAFGRWVFGLGRHNDVNLISWFGRDFAAWGGIVDPRVHEEPWLVRLAVQAGRRHEACPTALCAHYASEYQWPGIEAEAEILRRYAALAPPSAIAAAAAGGTTLAARGG
jgi:hypothetical protein